MPFPDVSKSFYSCEGRRWARHETRNKIRDAESVKSSEAGLNILKRGNVTGSMRENNGHFREQLKVENNRQDESLRWPLNLNNPWYC